MSDFDKYPKMWMVRAGNESFLVEYFIKYSLVAVGWDVPNLKNMTKDEIFFLIEYQYEYKKPATRTRYTNQLIAFFNEICIGDYVLTYNRYSKDYYLGIICSDYYFNEDIIPLSHPYYDFSFYAHIRDVKWITKFKRNEVDERYRKKLNNFSTVFKIKDELKENILQITGEI